MEINITPDPLTKMSAREAKEYILGFITTLKLTEKEIRVLEEESVKWKNRVDLARSRAAVDPKLNELIIEAEKELARINNKLAGLREEKDNLKSSIESMRRQIPGLAARERSIDPDLLEQELLMALGQSEDQAETDRAFKKLEKENAANDALEALKAKMRNVP